jgi:NifU-like N terminal domain
METLVRDSLVHQRTSLSLYIHKYSKVSSTDTIFFVFSCGDVMKLQIRVDENGIIKEAKFKTFGCGSAIASSSYMTELVTGMSIEDAGKIKNTEIAKELCLPPVKLHCSSTFISY